MENKIHKYLDEIDKVKSVVDKNAENFLNKLDIEKIMDDPRKWFKIYAKAFYDSHNQEMLEAINIGTKHGKRMLK